MDISEEDIDGIRELVNIGVGRAAETLNQITSSHIRLQIPDLRIITFAELEESGSPAAWDCTATVKLDFHGNLSGTTALIFPAESAAALVAAITGEAVENPDLDAIRAETLKEVGNIFINGVMGSIGNVLRQHVMYSPPAYEEDSLTHIVHEGVRKHDDRLIYADTRFIVEDIDVEGVIVMVLGMGSMDILIESLHNYGGGVQ